MKTYVRCAACRAWLEWRDEILAGPVYMCSKCWRDYGRALDGEGER